MSRGKQFETDIATSFKNLGAWVERFPDKMIYRGPSLPPLSVEGPPDYMIVMQGTAHLVECKARNLKHAKAIEFTRLKLHQLEALLEIERAGGHGWIAVLFYGTTNASKNTRCFLVPVSVWVSLMEGVKKSVNVTELESIVSVRRLEWVGRNKEGVGPWIPMKKHNSLGSLSRS